MRKAIVVDSKKCYACLSCVVECSYRRAGAAANAPLNAVNFSQAGCGVLAVESEPVPLVCHQCEDAPCLAVCPSGAIYRETEEGPILLARERCIGCKACIVACPFGMVRLTPDGKTVIKCDICADRLARGLEPVCVASCPPGAIEFKELDDVVLEARRRAAAALRGK